MSIFKWWVQHHYLPNKAEQSRKLMAKIPVRTLPVLGDALLSGYPSQGLLNAINAQCKKLPYKLDQLWGLADLYNSPGFTQYKLETGDKSIDCDCDDFAVYAVALAKKAGVDPKCATVGNLIINPWNQFTQAWANHVIAVFDYFDGSQYWTAVIDTNSAARREKPFWFPGKRTEASPAIIQHFSNIYNVNYKWLLDVPYPFESPRK